MDSLNTPQERRKYDSSILESISVLENDISVLKNDTSDIKNNLKSLMFDSDPEVHRKRCEYLDLVIEREKERAQFRKAIIEKTLVSLIWFLIMSIGYAVYHTFFTGRSPS